MTKIFSSQYKDQPAIVIENEKLKAMFLPHSGAKMVSLYDKQYEFEFLCQRQGEKYRLQKYDGNYLDGENAGFDDMFPNIDECFIDQYPWKGTRLPDHGEVWSLPWKTSIFEDKISFEVCGLRLPYKLKKTVLFSQKGSLRIDYELNNLSPFDMPFIWAAHLVLNTEENAEISIPGNLNKAVCTYSKSGKLGGYGSEIDWPLVHTEDGDTIVANRMRSRTQNDIWKYYFKDKVTQGHCSLYYPSKKLNFVIDFPADKVPYLGLLHNEGGSHDVWGADYYSFYFEPCTAPFDRPDISGLYGKTSVIKGNEEYKWFLELSSY